MTKNLKAIGGFATVLVLAVIFIIAALLLSSKSNPSQAATGETVTDRNGDGRINLVDARIIAPPDKASCPVCVDVNGDKIINQTDVDLVVLYADSLVQAVSQEIAGPKYKARFDINNDKSIDLNDVAIIQNYLGQTVTSPAFGLNNPSELTFGFMANDILVKFKPETTDSQKQAVFSKYGLAHKRSFQLVNTANLRTPEGNIENLQKQIAAEPVVKSTQKSYIFEFATDDPRWDEQWGHQRIRIEQTWFTETTGRTPNKVKVAIIDSGVDYGHFDLGANLSQTLRRNIEIDPVWPFEQQDVTDESGHGTFMAGIIGATANNSQGIAGLNWNVEIIPIKAAIQNSTTGQWEVPLPYLYIAMEWAAMHKEDIDVLSMSFGIAGITSDENIDYYLDALDASGVTLVAAAGNSGRDDSEYPANHPKVVSVGATGQNDGLCPNSSGRQSADILAPGDQIISTVPPDVDWDINHNGVEYLGCGTSQATAYVAGVAALCKAVVAVNASSDLKCNKFDHQGFGRIDAWATVWNRNCFKYDFNHNFQIGAADAQKIAFRYNQIALYNISYDIAPAGTDGQINDSDVWAILARVGLNCQPR